MQQQLYQQQQQQQHRHHQQHPLVKKLPPTPPDGYDINVHNSYFNGYAYVLFISVKSGDTDYKSKID